MALTYKEVAEIIKLIDASDCVELVLELEGTRLVIRRDEATGKAVRHEPPEAPVRSAPSPGKTAKGPAEDIPEGTQVRSPMVGTFYRKPSPEAPPFVEIGTKVAPGSALGLIEVMKLFTTLEAPCAGLVRAIAVEDTAAVEYDQLLFVIAPD